MSAAVALPLSMTREAGPLVFVSGQLPMQDGRIVGDDVAAQTEIVIDVIARHLAGLGLDLTDVVKTSVWLTSADNFASFNTVYAARFADPYPARSTVISALAIPGALIEIDAIAVQHGAGEAGR